MRSAVRQNGRCSGDLRAGRQRSNGSRLGWELHCNSPMTSRQQKVVGLRQRGLGRHAVAERVVMERHEIAELEPACVGFVHLSNAGGLILGEVVPIIVA
jgi:hypothetical protein